MLLHPKTKHQIDSVLKDPPHAVMISGYLGSGKVYTAKTMLSKMLAVSDEKLVQHPYFRHVMPLNNTVTIDQIRELHKFLSLKTLGNNRFNRAILIEDAYLMNAEAQNALLKILEEPPIDTIIILTALMQKSLKPTIYSRVQQIKVYPVDLDQAIEYYLVKGHASGDIKRAYHISNGAGGLLFSLLNDNKNDELVMHIDLAKQLLQLNMYERLLQVESQSKKPDQIHLLLFALKRICLTSIDQAALKHQSRLVTKWSQTLQLVLNSQVALESNSNRKLLLTNLLGNL